MTSSEGRVASRAGQDLGPGRQIRLRPAMLDHEARDGRREDPTPPQVVSAAEAGIEPGAVRVPRSGDIDDLLRSDAGDADPFGPRDDKGPFRSEGRDDHVDVPEEIRGRAPAHESSRLRDLRLVAEEVGRPAQQGAEGTGSVHVVNLLGRVERDASVQFLRESCNLEVVLGTPGPNVDEIDIADGVAEDWPARGALHRPLIEESDLVSRTVREHPGGRGGPGGGPEVSQVDAFRAEGPPVFVGEILAHEGREGRRHAEARGRAYEVPGGAAEVPFPVEDLDRCIRGRQLGQGDDGVHGHVAEHPEEVLHSQSPRLSCTSENRSNGMNSMASTVHSLASSPFAKTTSASIAGQRSDCPSPTYAIRWPSERSSKRRRSLHVPHRVHVPSAHGYVIDTPPSANVTWFVRTGRSSPHVRRR